MYVAQIGNPDATVPEQFTLHPNHPNPFNAGTAIRLTLAETARLEMTVYNLLRRRVADLRDGFLPAGHKRLIRDGRGTDGEELPGGGGRTASQKTLLRSASISASCQRAPSQHRHRAGHQPVTILRDFGLSCRHYPCQKHSIVRPGAEVTLSCRFASAQTLTGAIQIYQPSPRLECA